MLVMRLILVHLHSWVMVYDLDKYRKMTRKQLLSEVAGLLDMLFIKDADIDILNHQVTNLTKQNDILIQKDVQIALIIERLTERKS